MDANFFIGYGIQCHVAHQDFSAPAVAAGVQVLRRFVRATATEQMVRREEGPKKAPRDETVRRGLAAPSFV
jgi:hypothetical protein